MTNDQAAKRDPHDAISDLAKIATRDVDRALGSDAYVPMSSLGNIVVQLADRVAELTMEMRRLKTHDPKAEDGNNGFGTYRGVCPCGWETGYDEHAHVIEWVATHRAFYAETTS